MAFFSRPRAAGGENCSVIEGASDYRFAFFALAGARPRFSGGGCAVSWASRAFLRRAVLSARSRLSASMIVLAAAVVVSSFDAMASPSSHAVCVSHVEITEARSSRGLLRRDDAPRAIPALTDKVVGKVPAFEA